MSRAITWFRTAHLGVGARASALFLLFSVLRLPFRSRFLVNWDSVNFALGIVGFDVLHHQPHPPGYIGYVMLGRALSWLTGDANAGLTLLSVIAGGIAPAALYVLARRFGPERHALGAALLFGTSPLVWYYSSVGVTYMPAAAVTIPLVWACWVARRESSERHLLVVAGLLAVLGSLRQTDLVLLLPLAAYAAWSFPWKARLRACALGGGLTAIWLVPLVWVAGGPWAYLRSTLGLAGLAGGRTWVLSSNASEGLRQNAELVAIGLAFGLAVGILIVPVAVWYRVRPLRGWGREDRRLLLLWAMPALLLYLLFHTGQLGYVLVILPIGFVVLADVTTQIAEARQLPRRRRVPFDGGRLRRVAAGTAGVMVAVNAAFFFLLPSASVRLSARERGGVVTEVAGSMAERSKVPQRWRQFDLAANDRHWGELIELVGRLDPERTAVLAEPRGPGSFRHLAYYLPEHRLYGVGPDLRDDYGYLFRARDRETDYTVDDLAAVRHVLPLPEDVEQVALVDGPMQTFLAPEVSARRVGGPGGPSILVVDVPPRSALVFTRAGDAPPRIAIAPRGPAPSLELAGRAR